MIIDKNSDSSIDLEDWLRRSSDESELLARTDMLHSARVKDVYLGQTLDKFIVKVEYDEDTDTLTFIYNTEEKLTVKLDGPHEGGGTNVDLSEYAKLSDLESEVSELESKIPTSTSSLTNDSDFVNQTQVDDRIKEVIGAAPEALDTLQELSKALGDDPNFVGTVTDMISANTKLVEEVRSEIPSIEGLAKETWVTEQIQAIEIPSIEGLAKIDDVNTAKADIEKWVADQGYLTEHQDISHLATKEELKDVEAKIPSIEGLASEEWVEGKGYLTEHQDISGLATKDEIKDAVNYQHFGEGRKTIQLANHDTISGIATDGTGHNLAMLSKWDVADFGAVGVHMNLNTKDDVTINDSDIVATQKYVDDKVASIEHPSVDLTGYATEEWVERKIAEAELNDIDPTTVVTKTELAAVEAKIPSIEGLASEKYVDDAISAIEHPVVDLTPYAKSEDVTKAINESAEATKTWVGEQGYLTEHQDISGLATKEDIKNSVDYQHFTYNGEERKTIQLANHDTISGIDTKGSGHNLVMLSKWDVADFGAAGVHMNLNSSDKVTINDNDHVATEEWVNKQGFLTEHIDTDDFATKAEVKAVEDKIPSIEGLATEKYVDDAIAAVEHPTVDLTGYATETWVEQKIAEAELNDVDPTTVVTKTELKAELEDVVKYGDTSDGRKAITLANHDLIMGRGTTGDTHVLTMLSKWNVAEFGSQEVHSNVNTLSTTAIATDAEGKNPYVDGLTIYDNEGNVSEHVPVVTVNDKFALATVNHMMAIREADAKTNAETYQPKGDYALKSEVPNTENFVTVEYLQTQEYLTKSDDYVTQLVTSDQLNSKLAVLNSNFQWKDNVVTFDDIAKVYPNPEEGFSVYVDDEQATYVYMGGEWVLVETATDTPVATEEMDGLMPASAMRKLNSLENYDDAAIQGNVTTLEAKLAILEERMSAMSKTNVQTVAANGAVLSLGDATKDYSIQGEVSANLTVASSKSTTISDAVITNNARVNLKSTGDVELKSITTTGDFAKSSGNAIVNIPDAASVTIKDMVVESTQYNGIEIGLGTTLPKSVIIDNCDFSGEFSNNAISIHGTQDNAVINISNCKFSSVSNPLRISNKTGTRVTINITNCSCDKWETENEGYAGFLLCQDFTSTTVDGAASANLFGSDKVTINFINFTMPGGVRLTKPEDMSTLCGSGKDQLVYVYRNADYKSDNSYVSTPYGDGSAYPMINII